jgi:hypothetical protein
VTLCRSGLCSVVSSVGGMVSMLVMWLISLVLFRFALGVSCWLGGIVMYSLARRLRSVALLRNAMTSLWTVFVLWRRFILFAERGVGFWRGREMWRCEVLPLRGLELCLRAQLLERKKGINPLQEGMWRTSGPQRVYSPI